MVGGQTRTWTEEEVTAWYNARPSAGPQLRGGARAQRERSVRKPVTDLVLHEANQLVLVECKDMDRSVADLAQGELYRAFLRSLNEGSLPKVTLIEFKKFTRRALNCALRSPEVVEAVARLEHPPSPDHGPRSSKAGKTKDR